MLRLELADSAEEPLTQDCVKMSVAPINYLTNPVIRKAQGAHGNGKCGKQTVASSTSRKLANPAVCHDRKDKRPIARKKSLEGQSDQRKEVQPPETLAEPLTFAVSFSARSRDRGNPQDLRSLLGPLRPLTLHKPRSLYEIPKPLNPKGMLTCGFSLGLGSGDRFGFAGPGLQGLESGKTCRNAPFTSQEIQAWRFLYAPTQNPLHRFNSGGVPESRS